MEPVVFSNREERLCSPSLSKSTTFFRFMKLSFHREAKLFSSIARSVYAPPRTTSQPLFCILANFAATQCADPVTREMHFKQTHLPCQHKTQLCTNIQSNARPEPVFRVYLRFPHPLATSTLCLFPSNCPSITIQCTALSGTRSTPAWHAARAYP